MPQTKKKADASQSGRKRKVGKYKSFRLSKKIPNPGGPLPSAYKILKAALRMMWVLKKQLLGILAFYIVLNLVFVRGFSAPINISEIKDQLKESFGGNVGSGATVSAIFGSLLGSGTTNGTANAGMFQAILLIIVSLAVIRLFRQKVVGAEEITVRDAFYRSSTPLVPVLLVVGVIMIQLLPAALGMGLYGATVTSGVAATGYEKFVWAIVSGSVILLSLYMLCSSLFALYIVTIPDMKPMLALRSARNIVLSRRLNIIRKIMFLLLMMSLLLIFVVVPTIYFVPFIAPWLYLVLQLFCVLFVHAYLFTLYRAML